MKEVIIELDDMYSEVLSITAIGKHGNITNISTKAVELSKGAILKFDGENWTQRKSKHTGVVLEDEEKEVASDLISRSALLSKIDEDIKSTKKWMEKIESDIHNKRYDILNSQLNTLETYRLIIEEQPTAYNVDAVVEEVEKLDLDGISMVEDGKYKLIRKKEAISLIQTNGICKGRYKTCAECYKKDCPLSTEKTITDKWSDEVRKGGVNE